MLFVSYVRRSAKILILNKEGIIEKISYERCAYESVGERAFLRLCTEKRRKKEFMHLIKGQRKGKFINLYNP